MRRTITVLSGLLLAGTTMLTAQDDHDDVHNLIIKIPEVALLDLESTGDKTINLGPEGPKEAGEALDFSNQTNSELWINYSSVIGSKSEPARDITVQITSGKLPTGILLRVKSAKDAGRVMAPWVHQTGRSNWMRQPSRSSVVSAPLTPVMEWRKDIN
ncbi:MAG: hypothetical protein IPL46_01515 [Saprospiraceae bacterium]|nr:hypothetical protein [Saprospiraceae bacterium]